MTRRVASFESHQDPAKVLVSRGANRPHLAPEAEDSQIVTGGRDPAGSDVGE
jgi:hypothetical protein